MDISTVQTNSATKSNRRGRSVDPNSNFSKAKVILSNLPSDQLNRKTAVPLLVDQLGVTKGTAGVYFYTARSSKS